MAHNSEWKVEFCMPLTKHAGHYATRTRPGTTNAKEWLLRGGKPARFSSREAAMDAIAKLAGLAWN